MKIDHIYWFAYFGLDEPSVRYRGKYALEHLESRYGISYQIVYPGYDLRSLLNFLSVYISALIFRKNNSLIVFQKLYTNGIYSNLLRILLLLRPKATLYDIDDAEYLRFPDSIIKHFIKHSELCSGGSIALIRYMSQFNQKVVLLTSPVIAHNKVKRERCQVLTIGWIGYYGAHRDNLSKLLFPALMEFDFPIRLVLLGVKSELEANDIRDFFRLKSNIELVAPLGLNWNDELSIYEHIKKFDIGVAPLLDTEFNRAKSAFKLKQCLSCGIPVLASPVGENLSFIKDGFNGFFCKNPSEFVSKMLLIKELPLQDYLLISKNARESLKLFSVESYCDRLFNAFDQLENV